MIKWMRRRRGRYVVGAVEPVTERARIACVVRAVEHVPAMYQAEVDLPGGPQVRTSPFVHKHLAEAVEILRTSSDPDAAFDAVQALIGGPFKAQHLREAEKRRR